MWTSLWYWTMHSGIMDFFFSSIRISYNLMNKRCGVPIPLENKNRQPHDSVFFPISRHIRFEPDFKLSSSLPVEGVVLISQFSMCREPVYCQLIRGCMADVGFVAVCGRRLPINNYEHYEESHVFILKCSWACEILSLAVVQPCKNNDASYRRLSFA